MYAVAAPVRRQRSTRRITITSRTSNDGAIVSITLPGFDKQNIDVRVMEDVLRISAPLPDQSSFEKSFELNENIDQDSISASFENDVLTVKLPFMSKKKPEPRRIPVQGAEATPAADAVVAQLGLQVPNQEEQIAPSSSQEAEGADKDHYPPTVDNGDDGVLVDKNEKHDGSDDDSVDGSIEECDY